MTAFLAALALAAFAADPSKTAASAPARPAAKRSAAAAMAAAGVFELSVRLTVAGGKLEDAHGDVEKRLKTTGGAEVFVGDADKVAFSFGRGTPAELRKRMLGGIEALAGAGVLHDEKESFNPTFAARKSEAAEERKALVKERAELGDALKRAPRIREFVDKQVALLEAFDPAEDQRQGVLLVRLEQRPAPKP